MRKFLHYFFCSIIIFQTAIQSNDVVLPQIYPSIVEKLIVYKHNQCKVFHGGPITKHEKGVQWIMPIVFDDASNKTRAVYEVAFINCGPNTAHNAPIYFINTSDIDIKFKNKKSDNYDIFHSLISGIYQEGKYIVVRSCDIAHVFFPDIFIASVYGTQHETDKNSITSFLAHHFYTHNYYTDLSHHYEKESIAYKNETEIVFNPVEVSINLSSGKTSFFVQKRVKTQDIWKVYYIISKIKKSSALTCDEPLIRIDSGCVSGQIYDDNSCDCLDQLHQALEELNLYEQHNGFIIHIPAHDGRGFGTAPKAETEIYKVGLCGRIHIPSEPLNTVDAAKLLYNSDNYDLRSFNGAASVLLDMGISKVILLTDNTAKVNGLKNNGIEVIRKKTNTNKETCKEHLEAKKRSPLYFAE